MHLAVGEMGEAAPGVEEGGDALADFLAVLSERGVADVAAGVEEMDDVGAVVLARAGLVGLVAPERGARLPAHEAAAERGDEAGDGVDEALLVGPAELAVHLANQGEGLGEGHRADDGRILGEPAPQVGVVADFWKHDAAFVPDRDGHIENADDARHPGDELRRGEHLGGHLARHRARDEHLVAGELVLLGDADLDMLLGVGAGAYGFHGVEGELFDRLGELAHGHADDLVALGKPVFALGQQGAEFNRELRIGAAHAGQDDPGAAVRGAGARGPDAQLAAVAVHDAGRGIIERAQDVLHGPLRAVGVETFEPRWMLARFLLEEGRVRAGPVAAFRVRVMALPGTARGPLAFVGVDALAEQADFLEKSHGIERVQCALEARPPGFFLRGTSAFGRLGLGESEPLPDLRPAHLGNLAGHVPGVMRAAFVDGGTDHEVHAVGVKLGSHRIRDLRSDGLLRLGHALGQVAAEEDQMRAAAGAFAGNRGEARLDCEPGADGCTGIGFGIEIDVDERRAHDDADVVVAAVGEILRQVIRRHLGGDVIAPAFGDRFLAALAFLAAIWWAERMHGPAESAMIEAGGVEAEERVDVGRYAGLPVAGMHAGMHAGMQRRRICELGMHAGMHRTLVLHTGRRSGMRAGMHLSPVLHTGSGLGMRSGMHLRGCLHTGFAVWLHTGGPLFPMCASFDRTERHAELLRGGLEAARFDVELPDRGPVH